MLVALELVLIVMPKFKFNMDLAKLVESQYENIQFIPTEYEDDINNLVDFRPSWPTTGVMGIHFAIHHFDEVFIYGFDSFDFKYNTQHYFEDENAEYGKNKYKFKKSSNHIPNKEKKYISNMLKNRFVLILVIC